MAVAVGRDARVGVRVDAEVGVGLSAWVGVLVLVSSGVRVSVDVKVASRLATIGGWFLNHNQAPITTRIKKPPKMPNNHFFLPGCVLCCGSTGREAGIGS